MSKVIFENLSAVISALICFNSGILFSIVFVLPELVIFCMN